MPIFQEKVLWINSPGTPESGYMDPVNFGIFSEYRKENFLVYTYMKISDSETRIVASK